MNPIVRTWPILGTLFLLGVVVMPVNGEIISSFDANLSVRINTDVIQDNGANDLDSTVNRIVVDNFTPSSQPNLLVDGAAFEFRSFGDGGWAIASTSTPGLASAEWKFPTTNSDATPITVPVAFSADVTGLVPAGTPLRSTTHLHGDYVKVDASGNRLDPGGTINHARAAFGGTLGLILADGTIIDEPVGSVDGGLVQGETADVTYAPADVQNRINDSELISMSGALTIELGPNDAVHHPVSATLGMEVIPEPTAGALLSMAGLLLMLGRGRGGPAACSRSSA